MFRRASIPAVALCTACLLAFAARLVFAQAGGPSTQPLDFGAAGLDIAPAVEIIVVSPRTVDLLGEALLRETGARRLRLMRDLGECRSPLAAPHVRKMLSDPMPAMRAGGTIRGKGG